MQTYLVQLSFTWLACWLLYVTLLKREKFFQLNRFYLLSTLVFGLLLPLIEWPSLTTTTPPDWFSQPVVWLQTITIQAQGQVVPLTSSWHWADTLVVIYLTISFGFLIRLLYQFRFLYQRIKQGKKYWDGDICWVFSKDNNTPCSWMHYLFWGENIPRHTPEAAAIIAHEHTHIRQKHSWDILLLELLSLFFWWHPLLYAYRRELVDVHEYLADHASLRSLSTHEYGQLLLQQHLQRPILSLAQNFNSSHLKKRIIMMTKSPSKNSSILKYLLFLPLALLLVFACEETEQELEETAAVVEDKADFFERIDTVTTFNPADQSESVEVVKTKIYEKPEQMPVFGLCEVSDLEARKECSTRNLLNFIYTHVKYPKEASAAGQEGTVVTSLVVNKDGKVSDIALVKEKTTEYTTLNEEALRVIRQLPDFEPGTQDGKPVNVRMVLPIKFKLE
jgi:TonB family protein